MHQFFMLNFHYNSRADDITVNDILRPAPGRTLKNSMKTKIQSHLFYIAFHSTPTWVQLSKLAELSGF